MWQYRKYRLAYMTGLALIITGAFRLLHAPTPHPVWVQLIAITVATIVLWEGNLRIDGLLNKYYPWEQMTSKRLTLQLLAAAAFSVTALYLLIYSAHTIIDAPGCSFPVASDPLFVPGLVITLAILVIDVGAQWLQAWKNSLREVAQYKAESAKAELLLLKTQINPHFLFNNLNVLSSLVYKDQDKAVEFINELSKVYRYLLDNNHLELVQLREELEFLNHYIYLLQIKFGKGIQFEFEITEDVKKGYVPPMCLQILIENTIQHNEISQAKPLLVRVYNKQGRLIIQNNIQPRSDKSEGTQTGLANIKRRYAYFTQESVIISFNGGTFSVNLPILTEA